MTVYQLGRSFGLVLFAFGVGPATRYAITFPNFHITMKQLSLPQIIQSWQCRQQRLTQGRAKSIQQKKLSGLYGSDVGALKLFSFILFLVFLLELGT